MFTAMILLCSAKRADNGEEHDTIAPDAGSLFCQRISEHLQFPQVLSGNLANVGALGQKPGRSKLAPSRNRQASRRQLSLFHENLP